MISRSDLIAELQKATGPDYKLDLAISVAINYRDMFHHHDGEFFQWGAGGDEIELIAKSGKRIGFLDPLQFVPRWTLFIDVAMTLVPENWCKDIWLKRYNGYHWECALHRPSTERYGRHKQAPIAVCIAALRAGEA